MPKITLALVVAAGLVLVACGGYVEFSSQGPGRGTVKLLEGRQWCTLTVLSNWDDWRPAGYPFHATVSSGSARATVVNDPEDANGSFRFRVVADRHPPYGYFSHEGALYVPPGNMTIAVHEARHEARWSFECDMAD